MTRYKVGDTFKVDAFFNVIDIENESDWSEVMYSVSLTINDDEYYDEWLTEAELDDIVNPTAKLITLKHKQVEKEKEMEKLAEEIAKLESKINSSHEEDV